MAETANLNRCDRCHCTAPPFLPNLGILASRNPVTIDQAAADLVNASPLVPGSRVATQPSTYEDTLEHLHGRNLHGTLEHAESLGLGSTAYTLVELEHGTDPEA